MQNAVPGVLIKAFAKTLICIIVYSLFSFSLFGYDWLTLHWACMGAAFWWQVRRMDMCFLFHKVEAKKEWNETWLAFTLIGKNWEGLAFRISGLLCARRRRWRTQDEDLA